MFKAVLRGKLINLNSILKKKRIEKNKQLLKQLDEIEKQLLKRLGKKTLEKQRRLVKQQLIALETQEMVWALKKSQQQVFEGSNKPGKYFAYILKKKKKQNNKQNIRSRERNCRQR